MTTKKPTEPEPSDFVSTWAALEEGLALTFRREHMEPKYYMTLYSRVYNYCVNLNAANMTANPDQHFIGQEMYKSIEEYVSAYTSALTAQCIDLSGEALLSFYTTEWDKYRFSSKVLDGIFAYLNRHWIRREQDEGHQTTYMIYTLTLVIWKRDVFDVLEQKLLNAMLELIRLERTGNTINSRYIKDVIDNLLEIGMDNTEIPKKPDHIPQSVYKTSFEARFLEATREFYKAEVNDFMIADGCVTVYMKNVETRLQQEVNRVVLCLNGTTDKPLADCCDDVMITKQLEFIQSHFGRLLVQKMDDDLARMYTLCSRVPTGLDALRSALQVYVTKEGHDALARVATEAFNDPKLYVKTLLEVHERYQGLVDRSFKKEPGFLKSLDSAAIAFINKNAVTAKANQNWALKSSELMARYCDQLFRKSPKMPDENEMEDIQKQVITLFKYLDDKDVFLKFYTKMFSKRLINELSASDEAEASFIAKLTDSCGFEYTSRLSKMVQDIQVSRDLTSEFKDNKASSAAEAKKSVEFSAQVLSSGSWPNFPTASLILPQALSNTIEAFKTFYNGKYSGRRLTWVYSQCRGEVTSSAFKGKKYVFGVTTPQMCTLLLFNEQLSYEVDKIMSATGMDGKTTSAIVGSLVKNLVLTSDKPMQGDEIPLNATVTLNSAYTNKKVRVDLSKMTMKVEAAKDNENVQKNLDEDRKNIISACIVRIMKTRKTFQHLQLVTEVITQQAGRFKPKVEMIKRCIGMLIEKEYLRRVEDQKDVYEYLA